MKKIVFARLTCGSGGSHRKKNATRSSGVPRTMKGRLRPHRVRNESLQ